jgi:hypothetical protein
MPADSPQGLHEELQRGCTIQELLQLQRNLPKDNGQKNRSRPTSRDIHLPLRQRKKRLHQPTRRLKINKLFYII